MTARTQHQDLALKAARSGHLRLVGNSPALDRRGLFHVVRSFGVGAVQDCVKRGWLALAIVNPNVRRVVLTQAGLAELDRPLLRRGQRDAARRAAEAEARP